MGRKQYWNMPVTFRTTCRSSAVTILCREVNDADPGDDDETTAMRTSRHSIAERGGTAPIAPVR
jgi:hypothetical protein